MLRTYGNFCHMKFSWYDLVVCMISESRLKSDDFLISSVEDETVVGTEIMNLNDSQLMFPYPYVCSQIKIVDLTKLTGTTQFQNGYLIDEMEFCFLHRIPIE